MAGKKKRGHPDLEEVLARPWCYYCERDFDDLKILISHQKAKHFKCERCGRRLNTAGGLSVHMNQVHKETLSSVDNALGNRASLDVEIFGMEGIPEDVVQAHNQRIITQFYQAEADRRAATGNHGPGGGGGGASKRPKFESPADIKKRLAEHKARIAEQNAAGGSSGGNTPGATAPSSQSPAPPQQSNSPYGAQQAPYPAPPGAAYGSFTQEPYAQQPSQAYPQQYAQQPGYPPSGSPYPPQQAPYAASPGYPPQQGFPPGPYAQPPGYNSFQPPPHANPQISSLPPRPGGLPTPPGLPQRPSFGASPTPPYPMQHQGAPPPPQASWGANGWNGADHQNPAMSSAYPPPHQGYNDSYAANGSAGNTGAPGAVREPDDIDELIRMAEAGIKPPKKGETPPTPAAAPAAAPAPAAVQPIPAAVAPAETAAAAPEAAPAPAATPEVSEKKPKKDRDRPTKLVYADNEVSPEEKMAQLSRYAFAPDQKNDTVLADALETPGVAGVVDE